MTEYVVIRLAADNHPVQWVMADSNATRLSNVASGTLEQAAIECAERAVIVLVPAVDLVSTSVHIPARSNAKIRAALPFALEDELAEDVENLHFSIGDRQNNGRLPVVVVSNDKMSGWLQQLADVGIEASILTPDSHGLAKIPGSMSLLVDGDTVMFNDGADSDFVMQGIKPSDVLVFAGELGDPSGNPSGDAEEKSGHLLAFCTADGDIEFSHDWTALRHELHSVDVNVLPDGVLPKLAITVAAGHGVNLLQGRFGKKTEYSTVFKPWKTAAVLLLALTMVAMTMKTVSYYQLLNDEALLRKQFTTEYQAIRPDDKRTIVDPGAIVNSLRRSLGASTSTDVFLPSLRELGEAIKANPGARIEAISYRAGVIDLRLTAPDVATLDSIQKAVSSSGRFQASIQSTDQVADQINGRIQIREAG